MSEEVRNLLPAEVWKNFADLNAIPRASKKEEKVIEFIRSFGENLGLDTRVDEVGNIIIKKPATKGCEKKKVLLLQSHIDMVHQKNSNVQFDFDTQGIESSIEGEWVTANGTTLGADNGIGVAAMMGVLASSSIKHGPIVALFTVDEERGMGGAFGLKSDAFEADVMFNLDSEDEEEICIGCAGGINIDAKKHYYEESVPDKMLCYNLSVTGLKGGHSGVDIHLGRGNANKIINRLFYECIDKFDIRLVCIDGGSLRNAIPRESFAKILVPEEHKDLFVAYVSAYEHELNTEYEGIEKNIRVETHKIELPSSVVDDNTFHSLVRAIYACPNDVIGMSKEIPGLVETSNNVARVIVKNGTISIQCLARSSSDTLKMSIAKRIKCVFELIEATVKYEGNYPGWKPNANSEVLQILKKLYTLEYDKEAKITIMHAGLECGIIGEKFPDLDIASFGPTIKFPHSPDEKVHIKSVERFWHFLVNALAGVPVKEEVEVIQE